MEQVAQINPNIEVVGQYNGNHTKILHRCKLDGCEWFAQPANILNHEGCHICASKTRAEKQKNLTRRMLLSLA